MRNFDALVLKAEDDTTDIVTNALTELQTSVDTRLAAIEAKAADTKLTDRLAAVETKLNRPAIITDKAEPTEERKAFGEYLRLGGKDVAPDTLKTLTVSSDPQGGYLAPAEHAAEFIRNLVEFSPIRSVASVRTTVSPSVIYPARTSVTNAKWKGETQTQEGSEPAFGQAEVAVNELNTFVDISNQLLADSAGVAEAEVNLALAEDFGKKEGAAFLTGTGVNMPGGILNETGIASVAAAGASVIAFDDAMNLFYGLPAAYRNAGTWMVNTGTIKALRKLKDGNGQYIWQDVQSGGALPTLLGRPVIEALELDDIATGKTSVVFGDFSGYRIVDRLSMAILANPYLLATNGITRFHATRRVGGKVLQPAKFKKLVHP